MYGERPDVEDDVPLKLLPVLFDMPRERLQGYVRLFKVPRLELKLLFSLPQCFLDRLAVRYVAAFGDEKGNLSILTRHGFQRKIKIVGAAFRREMSRLEAHKPSARRLFHGIPEYVHQLSGMGPPRRQPEPAPNNLLFPDPGEGERCPVHLQHVAAGRQQAHKLERVVKYRAKSSHLEKELLRPSVFGDIMHGPGYVPPFPYVIMMRLIPD